MTSLTVEEILLICIGYTYWISEVILRVCSSFSTFRCVTLTLSYSVCSRAEGSLWNVSKTEPPPLSILVSLVHRHANCNKIHPLQNGKQCIRFKINSIHFFNNHQMNSKSDFASRRQTIFVHPYLTLRMSIDKRVSMQNSPWIKNS